MVVGLCWYVQYVVLPVGVPTRVHAVVLYKDAHHSASLYLQDYHFPMLSVILETHHSQRAMTVSSVASTPYVTDRKGPSQYAVGSLLTDYTYPVECTTEYK